MIARRRMDKDSKPSLLDLIDTEKEVCSQCDKEITGEVWYNYYAGDLDENILCGDGDCWAEWMNDNVTSRELENDE